MTNESDTKEFMLAIAALIRRVRSIAPTEMRDLSWTQKSVLTRLEESAMTTADLARLEGVKPQSMGASVAQLEEMGLIERKPHPTDGRQVLIKMTTKGTAVRKNTKDAKHEWIAEAISKLEKADQATLFKAGKIIQRLTEI